ncbi:hypothetical protein ABPG72_002769 [Tetrahymena utriculariae]
MQDKDSSFDIIELQNISADHQKDNQCPNNQSNQDKVKSNSAAKKHFQCLSQTSYTEQKNNCNPRNAVHYQEFKKEIKQMSYSERIKAFFSNATYNMKTFSKSGWKTVKINEKHPYARLFEKNFFYDERNPEQQNNNFLKRHEGIIWFSYRSNFPLIKDVTDDSQSVSNDYGWGCMIRCSQMLLAEALKRHYLNDQNKKIESLSPEDEKHFYSNIIKLFLDSTSEADLISSINNNQNIQSEIQQNDLNKDNIYSLFGIQNICQSAIQMKYQQNVKNWYTSIQVSVVLQEILEESQSKLSSKLGFHILNFTDQIIFLKELEEAHRKQNDKPNNILVMVHLKFGINKFEMQHKDYLIGLLKIKHFVGALSGTETKGMYIVGFQEDRLIVLDPHFIQKSTEGEQGLDKDYCTYFNKTPRSISLECISSDISLGYFIGVNEHQQLNEFIDQIITLNEKYQEPFLSILNDRIEIDETEIEIDETEIEEHQINKEIKNQDNQDSVSNISQNEEGEEQKYSSEHNQNTYKINSIYKNEKQENKNQSASNSNKQTIIQNNSNISHLNSSNNNNNNNNINNNNNNSSHINSVNSNYRIQDFYISNGSAISESSNSNLDKIQCNNEQDQISLAFSCIKKINIPSQIDNLKILNNDYQDGNKSIQKNVVYNDFEVIS